MGKKVDQSEETVPFEKALDELEKIIYDLERGQVGLADGLKKFERGVDLYRHCKTSLEEAEKKIKVLTDGLKEEDYRPEK